MIKKIFIAVMALVIFNFSILPPEQVDAFASKVATKAVKKVAQEAVKNEAVKMSMSFAMNYTYKGDKSKLQKPKPGYKVICLPMDMDSGICKKPMQIKENLTSSDKKNISKTADTLLDKKMNHKGWKKLLDWFFPIWIIGAGFTVVDLLLDGDLSNFFGDLAYEALVALGLLTPIGKQVSKKDHTIVDLTKPNDIEYFNPEQEKHKSMPVLGQGLESYNYNYQLPEGIKFVGLSREAGRGSSNSYFPPVLVFSIDRPFYSSLDGYNFIFSAGERSSLIMITAFNYGTTAPKFGVYRGWKYFQQHSTQHGFDIEGIEQHYVTHRYKSDPALTPDEIMHTIILLRDFWDSLTPIPPQPLPEVRPADVPVTKPNTTIKVPAPQSVPVKDKTGTIVKPKPDSKPDEIVWIRPDGKEVPETDIDVGDINVEETPDGDIIKSPDPDNPIEEGIINPDDEPIEEPIEEPEPLDPPNDFVCTHQLRKPRFNELGEEFSTTFPFNIPFDVYKSFNNIFVGMGSKKPEFDWDIKAFGDTTTIKFGIPDFFDKWQPFVKSLIRFSFSVGLIYMIFRFTKGGQ